MSNGNRTSSPPCRDRTDFLVRGNALSIFGSFLVQVPAQEALSKNDAYFVLNLPILAVSQKRVGGKYTTAPRELLSPKNSFLFVEC